VAHTYVRESQWPVVAVSCCKSSSCLGPATQQYESEKWVCSSLAPNLPVWWKNILVSP